MVPNYRTENPLFKRFKLSFNIKRWYKRIKQIYRNQIIQPNILRKKGNTDLCYPRETLADTKDCLSCITELTSKLVGMKFRKSPENIDYSTFLREWTKLCNLHRGVESSKFFQQRMVSRAWFRPGNLRGGFSRGTETGCVISRMVVTDLFLYVIFFHLS